MKTHAKNESSDYVDRRIRTPVLSARADFQDMSDSPTKGMYLNQQAKRISTNSRSAPMQRFQQLADQSTRTTQLKRHADAIGTALAVPAQRAETPNKTGLPDQLKSGIEALSGVSMDAVKVHYNSDKPAQLQAHAYAQGRDIHVAPGQERHLPHEAWHVVQQAQGRVRPTLQGKGLTPVNDDASLEAEADVMGAKAQGLGTAPVREEAAAGVSESVPASYVPEGGRPGVTAQLMMEGEEKKVEAVAPPVITSSATAIFEQFKQLPETQAFVYGENCECSTLANALCVYARSQGAVAKLISPSKKLLVDAATAIGGRRANTVNGKYWFFQNHVWTTINGVSVDPTFIDGMSPEIDWVKEEGEEEIGGKSYIYLLTEKGRRIFEEGKDCYVAEPDQDLTQFISENNKIRAFGDDDEND